MSDMSMSAPSAFPFLPAANLDRPNDPNVDARQDGNNPALEDSLTHRLNQFRLQGIGCDVAFVVGDEKERLLAHKLVLGCSSSVFTAMFFGPMATSKSGFLGAKKAEVQATQTPKATSKPVEIATLSGRNSTDIVRHDERPHDFFNSSSLSTNSTNGFSSNFSSFDDQRGAQPGELRSADGANDPLVASEDVEVEDEEEEEAYEEEGEDDDDDRASEGTASKPGRDDATTLLTAGAFSPFLSSFFHPHISSASPPTKMPRRVAGGSNNSNLADINHQQRSSLGAVTHEKNCILGPLTDPAEPHLGLEEIGIPDCTPSAFRILIQYLYSDKGDFKSEAVISDDNVMQTLYAAKKYDIRALVSECIRHLLAGLNASNAVCLLSQARLFQEETLLERCFHTIDTQTDIALQAESFSDIDRDTLVTVLSRNQLDPSSELVIFYAAQRWAESECERREITPTVENLRACLGPALQLIRFPLMSAVEFGQAASTALLNCEEIAEVFLSLTVRPRPFCRYPSGFRARSRSKHLVNRFTSLSSKRCTRRENKICFTTDRDVYVHALGVYGMALNMKPHTIAYMDEKMPSEWNCQLEIMLASVVDPNTYGSSLCHMASASMLLQGKMRDSTPCQASFDEPVLCKASVTYVASIRFIVGALESLIRPPLSQTYKVSFQSENGVQTYCGKDGQDSIIVDLPYDETVTFKFQSYRNAYGNDDGGKAEGQIPMLHFMVEWPDRG